MEPRNERRITAAGNQAAFGWPWDICLLVICKKQCSAPRGRCHALKVVMCEPGETSASVSTEAKRIVCATPTRPPRSETGANPCSLHHKAPARLHVPVGSEQSSLQAGLFTTTFVRGKGERCASSACSTASYCKARNTTPCGRPAFADPLLACVSHHTSRRSSTRRSESPTRRSKVSTRRSGVSHKAQCATALVSAPVAHPVLAAVCSLFRCAASVLFLLHNPLNKNTPNRGQIWLFLVHYNRSNLIICYDEVQKLKQSGNH